ncbi:hypothetical protein GCM10025734_77750 [Kitasatospora paranensis]
MTPSRRSGAALLALLTAAGLTACGSSGSSSDTAGTPTRLTVWIMRDSVTDGYLQRFRADFEKGHPGTTLDIQIQEWDGIGQKVTSALASKDAPDVIEVGNTQVAQYAASGGVHDLTDKVADLQGADWLPGLAEPGRIDGKQYGIPWYAANRVVIYNKDLFARAGITAPPKTRAEWLADTAKLNTGGNEGIYLSGQTWYALAGFIWDEGGDLAVKGSDGKWQGTLETPRRSPAWPSTSSSRHSARGPRTPTRPSRCRPRCSPRATAPRSSPPPAGPPRSLRPTPPSRTSSASSRSPARRRTSPARSSPAAPTWSCPRPPATGRPRTRWSRRWPARPGRATWPRR